MGLFPAYGHYAQAVQDFGKAIEMEPNNPNSYLGRGVAHFELGASMPILT